MFRFLYLFFEKQILFIVKSKNPHIKYGFLVAGTGFEPVISRLWALRDDQLPYPAIIV